MAVVQICLADEGDGELRRYVTSGLYVGEQRDEPCNSVALQYATALMFVLDTGMIDEIINEHSVEIFGELPSDDAE